MAKAIRQKIFFVMVLVFKVNNRLYPINAEKMKILHQKYYFLSKNNHAIKKKCHPELSEGSVYIK
jgi:hypothetical protein